jgi:hypothetical protein
MEPERYVMNSGTLDHPMSVIRTVTTPQNAVGAAWASAGAWGR